MKNKLVIKPQKVFSFDLQELWNYRELLLIFTWRDLKVRYKQTILGVVWVLFQPIVTTAIFSIFFGKLAKIPTNSIPYPLFSYAGLVIWMFFSNALSLSSQSLIENNNLLKKVYFPRILIPLSSILTALFDFFVSLPLLFLLDFIYGFAPGINLFFLFPIITLTLLLTVSGLGFAMSAINVKYRDVRYILPFFISTGLFLTPVIYPLSVILDYRRLFLILNPLTGVIENWRVAVTGSGQIDISLILISLTISIAVFIIGLIYFKKTEAFFADIV